MRKRTSIATVLKKVRFDRGCWEWTACRCKGYGHVMYQGKQQPAHRVVYELLRGPIPPGMELDHLCRNRGCVNPAHLEPVTRKENILRGTAPTARNARTTHCPKGHPYEGVNLYRSGGQRHCRACRRVQRLASYHRVKARTTA